MLRGLVSFQRSLWLEFFASVRRFGFSPSDDAVARLLGLVSAVGKQGAGGALLGAILALSCLLKLALLIPGHETYPVGDARDYLRAAHQLRDGSYTSIRPPLWPAARGSGRPSNTSTR